MDFIAIIIALGVVGFSLFGLFTLIKWIIKKSKEGYKMSSDIEDKSNNIDDKASINMNNKITIRFIIIGVIALFMLIPLGSVSSVVDERNGLYQNVLHGIAKQWGSPQVLVGPALVLPIVEKYIKEETIYLKDNETKKVYKDIFKNKNIIILPQSLDEDITLAEHYRHRSIYKSLVYQANIKIKGKFILPDISKLSENLHEIKYDKAFVVMGLSDTKAINQVSNLTFDNSNQPFEPAPKIRLSGINSGFHSSVNIKKASKEYPFHFDFSTKGSSSIRFSAFGETSDISICSSWRHPSFQGDILPSERNITNSGFSAKWIIPSLARSFPQYWINEDRSYQLDTLLTGVDLYEPVFLYSLVERSIKYGSLFIILTFLTFLIFELTQKTKLHFVQYALIGLSLGMFFLGLLSLSEHISFLKAYIIASAITITSISIYTWFNSRLLKQSITIFTLLVALYIILYSLLQLEDYALLMGTGLLLAILFVLMWITRNLRVEE